MTTFLQVSDNSETNAPAGSLNNTTSPITISGINTTKFSPVTTGYVVTIWDDISYTDPTDDPNMEKALVTAATIAANGSFTLTRPFAKAHAGTPHVALLVLSQHLNEITAAINASEAAIALKAPINNPTFTGTVNGITPAMIGLPFVNNTSDATKNVLSATKLTTARTINGVSFDGTANITIADDTKEPVISTGTAAQYWRGDKTWQPTLSLPISTATQTALDAKASTASVTSGLALKENAANKSNAALGSSTTLFPTQNSVKTYVDAADALKADISSLAPVATSGVHSSLTGLDADDHPQYHNDDRGDARYASQPYAVMSKAKFASLASSYGMLGKIFGNSGYLNDLQVYGESTQVSVPTPDVPVPIVSTTGNVTVRSASPSKNLFDAGVGITSGFYYDAFGTATASASDYIQTAYIPVLPNTTYTMSHAGNAVPKIVQYSSNQTFISRAFATSANSVTVTTASNTAFVRLSSSLAQLATTQFELGAVATAFAPHNVSTQTLPLGTTQLRSLPNGVSDRIYKSDGTWYLEQNVEEKTFTGAGSEAWFIEGTTATTSRFAMYPSYGLGKNSAICSRMPFIDDYNLDSEHMFITPNGVALYFMLKTSRASSVAALRTWLASNNTTFVLPLITPVTTTVTNPTLITALENIRTYQGITNITASTPITGSYGLDLTKTLAGKVDTTGDQTIAGVKTFTSAPIAPSGTSIGGALHLTGTGFPNGVVTAPVGSIYIDTAVTNGASSWIKKSGTGNTGWQVLDGDTGSRNIDTLGDSATFTIGSIRVRRTNNIVELAIDISAISTITLETNILTSTSLPTGFTPKSTIFTRTPFLVANSNNKFHMLRNTGVRIMPGTGGFTTTDGQWRAAATFLTTDPWPTTLPGTAV